MEHERKGCGGKSIYLYTKGTVGDCPEDLRKLLRYMEHSSYENAVSEELMEIHSMVTEVKRDRKVGLAYMKSYEIKRQMLEQGRKEGQKEERIRAETEIARLRAGFDFISFHDYRESYYHAFIAGIFPGAGI